MSTQVQMMAAAPPSARLLPTIEELEYRLGTPIPGSKSKLLNVIGAGRRSSGPLIQSQMDYLAKRDSYVCQMCHVPFDEDYMEYLSAKFAGEKVRNPLERGHIVPWIVGGLFGLSFRAVQDVVTGEILRVQNAQRTSFYLRGIGMPDTDVQFVTSATYAEVCEYDLNALETVCRSCNNRQNARILPASEALVRIERAYSLNQTNAAVLQAAGLPVTYREMMSRYAPKQMGHTWRYARLVPGCMPELAIV